MVFTLTKNSVEYTAVVAYDSARGIAKAGKIPWDLPLDRDFFRQVTDGLPVIVGRKTLDTILGRKLNDRTILELTTHSNSSNQFNNLDDLLHFCQSYSDAIVAGGSEVYNLMLPFCNTVIATELKTEFNCDKFFPKIKNNEWQSSVLMDNLVYNGIKYRIKMYVRA